MALFEKAAVKRWRRVTYREMYKLGLAANTPDMSAAIVMVAVTHFGTDVTALHEITGIESALVRSVLKRLRQQRMVAGQRVRMDWDHEGFKGNVAVACDALVAAGIVDRPVDPKRSAAMKARAPFVRSAPRRKRAVVVPGAVFTPKAVKVDPLYQIAKDDSCPPSRGNAKAGMTRGRKSKR